MASPPPTSRTDTGCEDHDPALYHPTATATGVQHLDEVGDQETAFYNKHGYLVVEQALSADEVAASIASIDHMITRPDHGPGLVYEAGVDPRSDTLTPQQRRAAVRKVEFFGEDAKQCRLPVDHPGLLSVAHRLMGGRQPELFQTMTLLKPPKIGREKPWHQDHAYFDLELDDRIVGIWIALDEATVANGCMQLIDGGHKQGPVLHWKRRDWQICDTDMAGQDSVAVPLKPGGALFFDSLLPHGTPSNHSPEGRRAMQFHYAPADGHTIATEQRLAVFGTEGKDVTC